MSTEPDLYALVLRLQPESGAPPAAVSGHEAHGLFLELVRQTDPQLSNALHASALSKHFTVAVLPPERGTRSSPPVLALRVTLMRSDLFPPFTAALLQQTVFPALRLGRSPMTLVDVLGTPGSHPWAGYSSFADLAGAVQPAQHISLYFATPTFTTRGTTGAGNKHRLNLLPIPEAIFGSLARRWNDLAPPALALDRDTVKARSEEVLVARYRIETAVTRLRSNVQVGFVGRCTYELPPDPAHRRTLALLADAAFYLGVGAKTTQGMGTCRRVEERANP